MMTVDSISVSLACNSNTWNAAREFLSASYRSAFGLDPSDPDFLFCATHNEHVVGTLGLMVPRQGLLAILERHQTFLGSDPVGVEFGRWSSRHEIVSFVLIRAAIAFALSMGATRGWCEQSPAVNRRAQRFGISFTPVSNACLDYNRIELQHEAYYRSTEVGLYWFGLAQAATALHAFGERRFSSSQ